MDHAAASVQNQRTSVGVCVLGVPVWDVVLKTNQYLLVPSVPCHGCKHRAKSHFCVQKKEAKKYQNSFQNLNIASESYVCAVGHIGPKAIFVPKKKKLKNTKIAFKI
jgi:hypothetical protein